MQGPNTVRLLILAVILLSTLVSGISVSAKPLSFLSVRGTDTIDDSGKRVLLRGINYPGYCVAPGSRPTSHAASAYARFARLGLNIVRLPISWAMLEPAPGRFDASYLTKYVDHDVQSAKWHGVYIVLDMHQYRWSSKFGGCGAPAWTLKGYPANESGIRKSIADFWKNSTLQDHLANVWREIAARYANEPQIAGYDILNEPWINVATTPRSHATYVHSFYLKVINAIRSVDPDHIIFLEPQVFNTYSFRINERIVWSPHFYPLSYASKYYPENVSVLEADLRGKYSRFVLEFGQPMWIGEFGAFMSDGSQENWLRDAIRLFCKYEVGWALWGPTGRAAQLTTRCP